MKQEGLTPEQILAMANKLQKQGLSEKHLQKELSGELMRQLKPEQSKQLQEIIRDKAAMERLMNSEQAKQLMKRFQIRPQQ